MCCYVCVLYSFKSLDKETSVLWYTCIYKGDTDKIIIQQINSVFSHLIYIFIFPFSEQAADGSLLTIYLWYILWSDILHIRKNKEQAPSYCVDFKKQRLLYIIVLTKKQRLLYCGLCFLLGIHIFFKFNLVWIKF